MFFRWSSCNSSLHVRILEDGQWNCHCSLHSVHPFSQPRCFPRSNRCMVRCHHKHTWTQQKEIVVHTGPRHFLPISGREAPEWTWICMNLGELNLFWDGSPYKPSIKLLSLQGTNLSKWMHNCIIQGGIITKWIFPKPWKPTKSI